MSVNGHKNLCYVVFWELTLCWVAQLPTHGGSIQASPRVITYSSPYIVHTDLHSAFIYNTTAHQSQLSHCASCVYLGRRLTGRFTAKFNNATTTQAASSYVLTFTTNTSISRVKTVMWQDWSTVALKQLARTGTTLDIIQVNWPTTSTKVGIAVCCHTCAHRVYCSTDSVLSSI